jgi:polar amino acid transport system substrate-binding protein
MKIGRWLRQSIILGAISICLATNTFGQSHPAIAQLQPSPIVAPAVNPAIAEPPILINGKTIKVATRIVPPFVVLENGKLGGFSIELWNKIAQKLEIKSSFIQTENVTQILDKVKTKQVDLAIAAISVTAQRERDFDFSQPIFDSGLQILVRNQGSHSSIGRLFSSIFTPTLFQLLGIMVFIVLIPAHIVWWVERNHRGGFLENSNYFPGIFKACWWASATLATQAEEMPKSPAGRIMAVIWMFISVVFIAYFTATVTTSLTVDRLQSNIIGPKDLPGKKIATVGGSTSDNYLKQQRLEAREFNQIDAAYDALNNMEVDAVVFDAPILLHYAAHLGKGKVQVVGSIFRKESYAIALPNGTPYRKQINNALLSLQEKGTYQEIYDKWFASK